MNPTEIIKITAEEFGVTEQDIMSNNRTRNISDARHMAMFVVMQYHAMSTVETGKMFERTHVSILYALRQVRNLLSCHKPTKAHYANIVRQIGQGTTRLP